MLIVYFIILFLLWICFWSFSTVLIERWHSWKGWVFMGRSECPKCKNTLSWKELFPLFSWILQNGKCKNCKTKIPQFYPLTETFIWIIFVFIGYISWRFWLSFRDPEFFLLLFWGFISGVYIVYDLRYMEIPDRALLVWIWSCLFIFLVWIFFEEYRLFFDIYSYQSFHTFLTDHIGAAIVLYFFFFLQILLPGWFFLLKKWRGKDFITLLFSFFVFPLAFLAGKTIKETSESWYEIPAWIGWWDLRVALFIWLTLWSAHGFAAVIFAYIIWSIWWVAHIFRAKIHKKTYSKEVPFWPFLWIGWFLALLFYDNILSYLNANI